MEKDQSTSSEHVSSSEQNKEQLEKVSDSNNAIGAYHLNLSVVV